MAMRNKSAADWAKYRVEETFYSPDAPDLYMRNNHLLFLADTFKPGFHRFENISDDVVTLGRGFTKNDNFVMHRYGTKNRNPVIFQGIEDHDARGHIDGEVMLVKPALILELDKALGNMLQLRRQKVMIEVESLQYAKNKLRNLQACWMYISHQPYYETRQVLGNLLTCERFTRKKNDNYHYYSFTRANEAGLGNRQ